MRKELKLTSVKVDANLFEDFKIECVRRKYTLNKLVNTAIKLYETICTDNRLHF